MTNSTAPWRLNLTPASFRGVQFHVETNELGGGRRDVVHEFPNRDTPYSEDLGRRARRFSVTGYIVGPTYTINRDALIAALEQEGAGTLILPTQSAQQVQVDHYTNIEQRTRGGMCTVEMTFSEAGQAISTSFGIDTASSVTNAANTASTTLTNNLNTNLSTATQ